MNNIIARRKLILLLLFGILMTLNGLGIINPLLVTGSTSPNIETEWEHYFGGSEGDAAHTIIQSMDGGFIILGLTESYGAGLFDFWLIKTNASGHHEWNKTFGGENFDWPAKTNSLIQTEDDGYAFVGHTQIWNESLGMFDSEVWLIKTDNNGVQEWNYTVEGVGIWSSLIQTADGGYVLSGLTVYNSQKEEYEGITLLKINSEGESVWNQSISLETGMAPLIQTTDGGFAIITKIGDLESAGDQDLILIKTDSTGNQEWNRTYSNARVDQASSILQLNDRSFVIAGNTGPDYDRVDFWLIKTDTTGELVWNTIFDSSHDVTAMIQTADGGFLLTGFDDPWVESAYLVKTDSDGKLEWETRIGEDNKHVIEAVLQTADGGYILAGSTGNPLHGGAGDLWLTKIKVSEGKKTTSKKTTSEFLLIFPVLAIFALVRWNKKK